MASRHFAVTRCGLLKTYSQSLHMDFLPTDLIHYIQNVLNVALLYILTWYE